MNFRKLLIYFTAAFLCLSSVLSAVAVSAAGDEGKTVLKSDFVQSVSNYIGWDSLPVTINSEAVFENAGGSRVSFGILPGTISRLEDGEIYPAFVIKSVTAHGLSCTVTQFADTVSDGSDIVAVYTRIVFTNETGADAALPEFKNAVPMGEVPGTVRDGESVTCDFAAVVYCPDSEPSAAELAEVDFDAHTEHMKHHWDAIISETSIFASLPDAAAEIRTLYYQKIISDRIGRAGVSVEELDIESMTAYELCQLVTEYTENRTTRYSYDAIHEELVDRLNTIASRIRRCSGGEYLYSEKEDPDYYSFDENINAMSELSAGARALAVIARAENRLGSGIGNGDEYTDIRVSLEKLSAGVSSVADRTAKILPCTWTAADTLSLTKSGVDWRSTLGAEDGVLYFEFSDSSASVLSRWYVENLALGVAGTGILGNMAKDAAAAASYSAWDGNNLAAAFVCFDSDTDTLTVGAGLGANIFAGADEMSISRVTGTKNTSVTVSCDKNVLKFSISSAGSASIRLELSAFAGSIEDASCGFDGETGVVTAPAGTSEVTVTLSDDAANIASAAAADQKLEAALGHAGLLSTEGCTSVSASRFTAALDTASAARREGSAEKEKAAEELSRASSRLSKTVSGYDFSLTDREDRGVFGGSSVYQKFSLPAAGSVTSVTLSGSLPAGTRVGIYTLDSDGITPEELIAETVVDGAGLYGSMVLDLSFEAAADTEYVLFADASEADSGLSLAVCESSKDGDMYTKDGDTTELYRLCALDMRIGVTQADRSELDAYYRKCSNANVDGYTKESVKKLRNAMNDAAEALCTPDEEKAHCDEVYEDLRSAFSSLSTYASDTKLSNPPPVLYILLGVTTVLLCGALLAAASSGKKNSGT